MSSVKGDLVFLDALPYIYSGTAAVVAEICTFPLDTAKTILQLQGSAGHPTQYHGTADCLYTVARQEGWVGCTVVRQAVYGTIKYGLYYSLKDMVMCRWGGGQESMHVNMVCSILAGLDQFFNYLFPCSLYKPSPYLF
jgi:solute carrier family 25 protein 14/30